MASAHTIARRELYYTDFPIRHESTEGHLRLRVGLDLHRFLKGRDETVRSYRC